MQAGGGAVAMATEQNSKNNDWQDIKQHKAFSVNSEDVSVRNTTEMNRTEETAGIKMMPFICNLLLTVQYGLLFRFIFMFVLSFQWNTILYNKYFPQQSI